MISHDLMFPVGQACGMTIHCQPCTYHHTGQWTDYFACQWQTIKNFHTITCGLTPSPYIKDDPRVLTEYRELLEAHVEIVKLQLNGVDQLLKSGPKQVG